MTVDLPLTQPEFANTLRAIRTQRRHSYETVSRLTGLSTNTIWKAENGHDIRLSTAHKLIEYINDEGDM